MPLVYKNNVTYIIQGVWVTKHTLAYVYHTVAGTVQVE